MDTEKRVIKFRVYDSEIKKVSEGAEFWKDILPNSDYYEEKMILMQFIGLKDKNGKEIYEGDLLKVSMGGEIQDSLFEVENMWDLEVGMADKDNYTGMDSEFEIIGNIYENPELIKN